LAPDGSLFAALGYDGLVKFDGSAWTLYTDRDDIQAFERQFATVVKAPVTAPMDIAFDTQGSLWVIDFEVGLLAFDGETWQQFEPDFDLHPRSFRAIATGKDAVWIATRTDGLVRFDGSTWQRFTMAEGLPGNWVNGVATAADGSIWMQIQDSIVCFRPLP